MMTLDEAIKNCEEVADMCEFQAGKYDMTDAYESYVSCQEGECAEEHRQLAEWLKELKESRMVLDKIRAEIEALPKTYPFINHIDMYVKEDDVKKIIDKYKAGK